MMPELSRNLRLALRTLRKSLGFTFISLITLGLGIGATTAMFSVVNSTLLRPLPFNDPSRLVLLKEVFPKVDREPGWIPAPDVIAFQKLTRSFDGVGGYLDSQMDLAQTSAPVRITIGRMNWTTFNVLGVSPLLGRTFTENEDRPDSHVVVLSYDCWQRRFGGATDILNKKIELNRNLYDIVGVMPAGFMIPLESAYPTPVELWVPMGFTDREKAAYASLFIYGAVARLKPGVTLAQAQADAESVMPAIRDNDPPNLKKQLYSEAAVVPFAADTYRTLRAPIYVLFLAVTFVLLIAVANVASLMLVRGSSRQRDLAIRISLGATRRGIVMLLLTESVLLSLAGGAIGVVVAQAAGRLLISKVPGEIHGINAAVLDYRVLLFTVSISVAAGILFGLAPALLALRTNITANLKEGGRSGGQGPQHQRLRSAFVVVQMALALILLVGSGLLIRSFQRVMAIRGGFEPEHVTVASLFLPLSEYPRTEQVQSFLDNLLSRVRQIPGIKSASLATGAPLKGGWMRLVEPEGYVPPPGAPVNGTMYTVIHGDYFSSMGIPLVRGRFFSPEESVNGTKSAIISESFAKRYFSGQDPLGRQIRFSAQQLPTSWLRVVGIVGDVKASTLEETIGPQAYVPFTSEEIPIVQRGGGVGLYLFVKSSAATAGIGPSLQSAVWGLDGQLPVTDITTMTGVVERSTAPRRFTMLLIVSFAGCALLLAAVGLYGVMSYSVAQRTHEVGIRVALGAARSDITGMVLRWGVTLAAAGIITGTVGAFALTRLLYSVLSDVLYGVAPTDPATYIGVAALLFAVAALACYVPAARASRVDPMIALRNG